MVVPVVRVEIDAPTFDGDARRVVRSLREIGIAADEIKRSSDQAENSLRRLIRLVGSIDSMHVGALAEFDNLRPVQVAANASVIPAATVLQANSVFGRLGAAIFDFLVRLAGGAAFEEFRAGSRSKDRPDLILSNESKIQELENRLGPGVILPSPEEAENLLFDVNGSLAALKAFAEQLSVRQLAATEDFVALRAVEGNTITKARELHRLTLQLSRIEELSTRFDSVSEKLRRIVDSASNSEIGSLTAGEETLRQLQDAQGKTLDLLKDLQAAMEPLPEAARETIRLLLELLQQRDMSAAGQAESLAPVQEMSVETKRLLQDVLTELQRLLQEIDGTALLRKSCEGAMPVPGPSQPGLPGSEDPAGDALCPTEELERQRDCLLLEGGEATNGLQAGLQAYAESALNVNEQVKAATVSAFQGMEDALVSFVQTGKLNFKGLADAIIADLIRIAIQSAITGPFANFLAGLGQTETASITRTGTTIVPGMAQGGSFTVGGGGGTDSQTVRFRATPGERVTVTRPDRRDQAGGVNLTVNVNNEVPEARVSAQATEGDNGTALRIQVARVIAEDVRAGGEVFRSFRDTFGANPVRREVS